MTIKGALGTRPSSTFAALDMLNRGDLPFGRMNSGFIPLEGIEDALRRLGGEVAGGAPIHLGIDPWA